jgi:hypothetical protein
MSTAAPSTALATIQPAFTNPERLALAGYLAGYRGLTREAYALDLRQFATWCRARSLNLFAVRRADIESFARDLEARGRARATVTRRLSTIAGFYKYAVEVEHPEFGGDSILPRCSGLGDRCLPRYCRLTEPRADHFPASVLSNICPAALSRCLPGAGAARQVFPGGTGVSPRRAPPALRRGFPGRVKGDAQRHRLRRRRRP